MIDREIVVEMDEVIDSIISRIESGSTVTMVGRGTSMMPFIEPGTHKIVLSRLPDGKKVRVGEIYLYRRSNSRYSIHRVYSVTGNTLLMCGDSQITLEEICKNDLLAIVTQVIKDEKTTNCLSSGFLLFHRFRMRYRQFRYRYDPLQMVRHLLKKAKEKLKNCTGK